ncbi:MAG: hypothetical protein ACOZEN_05540 [Thermodesulfobacteriota bacterium]
MEKARFMGRMAASVSHDLCNVLATIQQATGLLSDYLALARRESLKSMGLRPKFKYDQKFEEIIGQVQTQVDRGQTICEHLSHLAHSADETPAGADLAQACRLIVGLAGRVAKKHKVSLAVEETPDRFLSEAPMVEVLACLDAALLGTAFACREQGTIRFRPGEADGRVHVDILCQALEAGEAASLAKSLEGGKPGPLSAGVVQGGVRLAFEKAGRKA